MKSSPDTSLLLNQSITRVFKEGVRMSFKRPSMALFMYHTLRRQKHAARIRQQWEKQGTHVPAFLIASITTRCNLRCTGCFALAQQRFLETEMSAEQLRRMFAEADELGISIILLSGGEPLTRPEILDITQDFPGIIFPLFTNGLLINEDIIRRLKQQKHVIPVVSLEGDAKCTNHRRGQGVYEQLQHTLASLHAHHIFWGTSLTVTRENVAIVTTRSFISDLIGTGCRLIFFVDYAPAQPGTEALVLTEAERAEEARMVAAFRSELPALFFAFPGDEKLLGGCIGAGRGMLHISPSGRIEPCPAAPFSDVSLQEVSLKDALQSKLLRTIRAHHDRLDDETRGCALWKHRDWIADLAQEVRP
jgi:MoaA/NifB/PqqE/SkfB family radical SAM enzyme